MAAKRRIRNLGRVVTAFWDWWGVVGTLVKISILPGGIGGGVAGYLDHLTALQMAGLVLAGMVALPAAVWAAASGIKAIWDLLADDVEPKQALTLVNNAGVVAVESPTTQSAGNNARQFGAFTGTYHEAETLAVDERTLPNAWVFSRGNQAIVKVENPGDADRYSVKLSNFVGAAPHLTLSPSWRNGSEVIEILRGGSEECQIMSSAIVPTAGSGFFELDNFTKNINKAQVTFYGGEKVQTITVEKLKPWAVTISIVSSRGQPIEGEYTYAVTSQFGLVMPYTVEALEAEEARIQQQLADTLAHVRKLAQHKEDSQPTQAE